MARATARHILVETEEKNSEFSVIDSLLYDTYIQKLIGESAINSLGYYYLNRRRIESALAIFQFNVKTFPHSANVYDSLGEAYYRKGDKENAVSNYNKSLDINPQNQNARYMLKVLDKINN